MPRKIKNASGTNTGKRIGEQGGRGTSTAKLLRHQGSDIYPLAGSRRWHGRKEVETCDRNIKTEYEYIPTKKPIKTELYHDNFQNFKKYGIPKAQLVIADIPYNLGNNAYASSTEWYLDGDNKKGESDKAGKQFFNSDKKF